MMGGQPGKFRRSAKKLAAEMDSLCLCLKEESITNSANMGVACTIWHAVSNSSKLLSILCITFSAESTPFRKVWDSLSSGQDGRQMLESQATNCRKCAQQTTSNVDGLANNVSLANNETGLEWERTLLQKTASNKLLLATVPDQTPLCLNQMGLPRPSSACHLQAQSIDFLVLIVNVVFARMLFE